MISLQIHNADGQPTGSVYEFDPAELADGVNKQLLHDAVVMYQANRRQGTFKTKTRSEVSGCSKKMYKQKGTGNARAGGKRSPVRRGGGHAFAKRPVDYSYRMPKKALRTATRMALLSKLMDDEVFLIDQLTFDAPQTKRVYALLKSLGVVAKPRPTAAEPVAADEGAAAEGAAPARKIKKLKDDSCLLATESYDVNVWKSARNLPRVTVSPAAELNAYDLLRRKRLVVTVAALDRIRGQKESVEAVEA